MNDKYLLHNENTQFATETNMEPTDIKQNQNEIERMKCNFAFFLSILHLNRITECKNKYKKKK